MQFAWRHKSSTFLWKVASEILQKCVKPWFINLSGLRSRSTVSLSHFRVQQQEVLNFHWKLLKHWLHKSNQNTAFLFFTQRKFSTMPSVFVTAVHQNPGLKRDAASLWIENVTHSSFSVCLRELQNYAGSHEDILVVSVIVWHAAIHLHTMNFSIYTCIFQLYFGYQEFS